MATRRRHSHATDRSIDRWIFVSLVGLLIWAPLQFGGNRPSMWWITEVWILLTAVSWLVYHLRGQVQFQPACANAKWVILLLAMSCVWILCQAISADILDGYSISHDPHTTLVQFTKSLSYLTVFCLCLLLVRTHGRLQVLATVLVLCGTFQAVYGTMMTVTGLDAIWFFPKEAYRGVATGTFINRNHLAGYLEMALAIGIGLLIANLEQGRAATWRANLRRWITTLLGPKARLRIYLALMVIGLIMTRSRMGNTAFFSSMMIAGTIGLLLFRQSSRSVVILFASLIVIDVFLMGAFFGIDKLQERFEKTSLTTEQRDEVNLLSLPIIQDHPLTGTGVGSYYSTFPRYRDGTISAQYIYAHNDYVQFTAEFGLIGVVPLALAVILSFITAIRVQIVRRSRLMKGMGFAATMAIIAIMIHSSTDFNLQINGNAVTFMVVLALPWIALTVERR